jgi:hypothetical protein
LGGKKLTVTSVVETTVAHEVGTGDVGAKLLWCGPEVVHRTRLIWEDCVVKDEDVVDADALA